MPYLAYCVCGTCLLYAGYDGDVFVLFAEGGYFRRLLEMQSTSTVPLEHHDASAPQDVDIALTETSATKVDAPTVPASSLAVPATTSGVPCGQLELKKVPFMRVWALQKSEYHIIAAGMFASSMNGVIMPVRVMCGLGLAGKLLDLWATNRALALA